MTTAAVELRFNPTDLRPQDIPRAGPFLGSPAEALEAAFAVTRAAVVDQVKTELKGIGAPTYGQLLHLADMAWQLMFWRYRRLSAPIIADAYVRAYRAADAGDVPMSLIYDLADKHAEKIGTYFHESSREALAQGFNTLVNRQVPAKAAAERVMDAYGLTPRQMSGYTSAAFEVKQNTPTPRSLRARARAFIEKSFTSRIKKFSTQEEHNIDQQAQQLAWMWLQDKGRLNEKAQKMWITARDERVCAVCGPLHGRKVGINDQFKTKDGLFWSPGLHPNCRCEVRLIENKFSKNAFGIITKAEEWDPKEHPRGGDPKNRGRFSRTSGRAPDVAQAEQDIENLQRFLDQAEAQQESKPVIEVAPEEPEKVSLGGDVSLGSRVSLGPKVSLGGKVSLNEKVGLADQEKTSLGGRQRVGMPTRELVNLAVTPKMQVALEQTLQRVAMAGEQAAPLPTKRPKKLYHRPTIRIQDSTGREYPVYTVVDLSDDLNWHGNQVELNNTIDFYPSMSTVAAKATNRFRDLVQDRSDTILGSYRNQVKWHMGEHVWETEIPDDTVVAAVTYQAYKNRVPTGIAHQDNREVELEWVDGQGNIHPHRHSLSEIADLMDVKPSDFDLVILRMTEGHFESPEGSTYQESAGTKAGEEAWVTSGVYNTTDLLKEMVDETLMIQMVDLEPDVEERELPTILGGEYPNQVYPDASTD